MTTKPTDEMLNVAIAAADEDGMHLWRDTAAAIVAGVLTIAEMQIRAAVAADIEAALAADQGDSDVTSGESIWHQSGYRDGLQAAVDIARDPS